MPLGDAGGLEDCRRGIEIARAGGAIWELHYALNNMITGTVTLGRVQDVGPLLDEWKATFEEMGGTHYSHQWYLVCASEYAYFSGDWDDTLAYIDQFRAGIPKGQIHYLESGVFVTRATIMRGRGRDAEALDDAERALEVSRNVTDAQILVSVLCAHAAAMLALGDRGRADEDWSALTAFGEVLPNTLSQGDMVDFAWLALDLGRRDEALAVVEQCESADWVVIGRSILRASRVGPSRSWPGWGA